MDIERANPPPDLSDFVNAWAWLRPRVAPGDLRRLPVRIDGQATSVACLIEGRTPIRSFKLRGSLFTLHRMNAEARARGVVTCSTGNHGLGLAYAATRFDTRCAVFVPHGAAKIKIAAIEEQGAAVRFAGTTLTEAELAAKEFSEVEGARFIEDGNDAGLMAGAGSIGLDLILACPDVASVVLPVGGGNLIAGVGLCLRALRPDISIIGVQSSAAPAAHDSWRTGQMSRRPATTFAGGLATERPGELALAVMRSVVDDFVLVSDDQIRAAMSISIDVLGEVLEPSGAAVLAAVPQLVGEHDGGDLACVLTGSNVSSRELAQALTLGADLAAESWNGSSPIQPGVVDASESQVVAPLEERSR